MTNQIEQIAAEVGLIASEYNGFDRTALTAAEIRFAEAIWKKALELRIADAMRDPTYQQAMDEYYERKWAHRFD